MPRLFVELREAFRAALQALRAHLLRSTLTTVGVVVGVTAVIAIVSLIQGLDRAFADQISGLGSNRVYVDKYPWIIQMDFWRYRNRKDITLDQAERYAALARLPAEIATQSSSSRTIKWGRRSAPNISVQGQTTSGQVVNNLVPISGRFFSEAEARDRRQVVVLGHAVWTDLFEGRQALGERIRIGGQPFTVIGVLPEKGSVLGQSQDRIAVIPLPTLLKLFGSRRSLQIALAAPDASTMAAMEDEARGIMRHLRGVPPWAEDDFALNRQEMLLDLYRSLTTGLYAVLIGVAGLSLLVGGIGIMNIMLVSVTERTREIGIRKSVGARRRDILRQFLIESVLVSGLGGVIGLVLGLVAAFAVAAATPLPAAAPLWAVIAGIGFSVSVGLFFGLYPAARAAALDPIEALGHE